jgi:hypothetical protein
MAGTALLGRLTWQLAELVEAVAETPRVKTIVFGPRRHRGGGAIEGAVQGAEAVRSIVIYARTLYDYQEFNFAGPMETTVSSRTTPLRSLASRSA